MNNNKFIPITKDELQTDRLLDVIIISGDAYVDHPSFGTAVIARLLESLGLLVAIIPQPNWRDDLRDFKKFGRPKYFFAVTSGNMDSMVNHYTATKRLRSDDAYTPDNKSGFRPDYAVTVYSKILKKLYPEVPIVLGGVEASMRRLAHYDYWSDKLFPSILVDSGADLLLYGMAEKTIKELVKKVITGTPVKKIMDLPQSAFLIDKADSTDLIKSNNTLLLDSYKELLKDKDLLMKQFLLYEKEQNSLSDKLVVQEYENSLLVLNPSYKENTSKELDEIYELPFTYLPHPKYKKRGAIPAYEMIKFSLNSHRGCFGGCSFCTITFHQGRKIISRSIESLKKEAAKLVEHPEFKGTFSDIGGPSANMYQMAGKDQRVCEKCSKSSCIYPIVCSNLDNSHKKLLELYEEILKNSKIKHLFIGSGIRFDMVPQKEYEVFLKTVLKKHISGRLKVAPEHSDESVLKLMRKPCFDHFLFLKKKFEEVTSKENLKLQLIPYMISAHPGCSFLEMADMAFILKTLNLKLEQVQDFTPTPMTLSSVMYYLKKDDRLSQIFVAQTKEQKDQQKLFFFFYKKENIVTLKNILKAAKLDGHRFFKIL